MILINQAGKCFANTDEKWERKEEVHVKDFLEIQLLTMMGK